MLLGGQASPGPQHWQRSWSRGSLHRGELQVSMDTHYSQPKDENLTQPMSILHVKTWHCAARLQPTQYSEQNMS